MALLAVRSGSGTFSGERMENRDVARGGGWAPRGALLLGRQLPGPCGARGAAPPRRPSGSPAKCSEVSRGKHPRRCALLRHQPLGWGGRPPPPALARLDVARPRCLRRAALDPLPTAVAPVLQQPSGAPGELQLASERRGSPTPSPPRLDPTSRSMAPKAPWSPFSTGDLPWRKLVGLLRVRHKGTEEVPLGKR